MVGMLFLRGIFGKLESIREKLRQQKFSFQIQIGLTDKICAFESEHRFSQQLFSSLVISNTKHNLYLRISSGFKDVKSQLSLSIQSVVW